MKTQTPFRKYELLVKAGKQPLIGRLNYGPQNKINGISGSPHQIDISYLDYKTRTLILIECKFRQAKPIYFDQILTFHSRILDIGKASKVNTKGIVISSQSFPKGVKKYANYYGIELYTVKNEHKFFVKIQDVIGLGMEETITFLDDVKVYKSE
jgi:hypothetical protein